MFEKKWIVVNSEDYVLDVSEAQDGSQCLLLLIGLDGPYNIFGTPLFQGYYTIHDQSNKAETRLGFVPTNISSKPKLFLGSKPSFFLDFDDKAKLTRNVNSKAQEGMIFRYVIEGAIALALLLVYFFVALPGF